MITPEMVADVQKRDRALCSASKKYRITTNFRNGQNSLQKDFLAISRSKNMLMGLVKKNQRCEIIGQPMSYFTLQYFSKTMSRDR